MMRKLLKQIGKILGFEDEEYLRRRAIVKEEARKSPFVETWITPFNYVLVSVNILICWLFISNSHNTLNLTPVGFVFVYIVAPVITSAACLFSYVFLESFIFNKVDSLKSELSNFDDEDSFPKMVVKVFISCAVTYPLIFLYAYIS
ncbi:MAG: hypothetical protein Q7U70_00835 [Methylotenera sp.]|nr:hypothetical protein [Methylotenera sp.]MDO9389317.1 hypothetical protein [Methylotenera sp.]